MDGGLPLRLGFVAFYSQMFCLEFWKLISLPSAVCMFMLEFVSLWFKELFELFRCFFLKVEVLLFLRF